MLNLLIYYSYEHLEFHAQLSWVYKNFFKERQLLGFRNIGFPAKSAPTQMKSSFKGKNLLLVDQFL